MKNIKLKCCGLTNQKDYQTVCDLGYDFAGFIFYSKSKRFVKKENVLEILKNTSNQKKIKKVGVFVNETKENILDIYHQCSLDVVQLHGDESIDFCNSLGLHYWKVIRLKNKESLKEISLYNTDAFLLDAYDFSAKKKEEIQYGGLGKIINLDLLEYLPSLHDKDNNSLKKKIIIAGGLKLKNIKSILAKINSIPVPSFYQTPFALDINSGAEKEPGLKDKKLLMQIKQKVDEFNLNLV